MSGIERVDQFYMSLVTIQVENGLFKVPRQSLESQSQIFRDMFSLPTTGDAEGSSDENPIQLKGVTKEEFQRFLEVLFLSAYEETPNQPSESTFEMWFPVLKLARMWECDAIHKYVLKNMPYKQIDRPPAEKVGLAVQYDIQPWLLPGVNELARRKEPIGSDDLVHLGVELALKVAAVRESFRMAAVQESSSMNGKGGMRQICYGGSCAKEIIPGQRDSTCSKMDFTPVIKRVFQLSEDDDTHTGKA